MPELVRPHVRFQKSYLAALAEDPDYAQRMTRGAGDLSDEDVFVRHVDRLLREAEPGPPRFDGWVPCTTFWWVENDEFLARVAIRHELKGDLWTVGGHIGYWVRPSARRRGHGLAAFRAVLPEAAALGIDPALVTCDWNNEPSRRIIEAGGGVLENRIGVKLRFWVPTGSVSSFARSRS